MKVKRTSLGDIGQKMIVRNGKNHIRAQNDISLILLLNSLDDRCIIRLIVTKEVSIISGAIFVPKAPNRIIAIWLLFLFHSRHLIYIYRTLRTSHSEVIRVINCGYAVNASLGLHTHVAVRCYIALDVLSEPNLDLIIKLAACDKELRIIGYCEGIDRVLMLVERGNQSSTGSPSIKARIGLSKSVIISIISVYSNLHELL